MSKSPRRVSPPLRDVVLLLGKGCLVAALSQTVLSTGPEHGWGERDVWDRRAGSHSEQVDFTGEAERDIGAEGELESSVVDPSYENAGICSFPPEQGIRLLGFRSLDPGSSTLTVILEVVVAMAALLDVQFRAFWCFCAHIRVLFVVRKTCPSISVGGRPRLRATGVGCQCAA